jgi:hypothetical protein
MPRLFEKARALSWAFSNTGLFQKCDVRKEKCVLEIRCTMYIVL